MQICTIEKIFPFLLTVDEFSHIYEETIPLKKLCNQSLLISALLTILHVRKFAEILLISETPHCLRRSSCYLPLKLSLYVKHLSFANA